MSNGAWDWLLVISRLCGKLLETLNLRLGSTRIGSVRRQLKIITDVLRGPAVIMPLREDGTQKILQFRNVMLRVDSQSLENALLRSIKVPQIIVRRRVQHPILREINGIQPQQLICRFEKFLPLFLSGCQVSKLLVGADELRIGR